MNIQYSPWSAAGWCLLLLTLTAVGCQQQPEPRIALTMDQWRHAQGNFVDEVPEGALPVNAVFDDNIELLAWSYSPENPEVGEDVTLNFYWRASGEIDRNYQIFVHADGPSSRQGLDHHGVDGAFPVLHWPADEIVHDHVTRPLSAAIGDGVVHVRLGLYDSNGRAVVTSAGEANEIDEGRIEVGSFNSHWEPPVLEGTWTEQNITIDGRLVERSWASSTPTDRWGSPSDGAIVESQHAFARVLWDAEHLYVAIRARDTDIWSEFTERDQNLWEEEVLEVYLDPGRDGRDYIELQINPNNAVFDALFSRIRRPDHTVARNWNLAGMETAVHVQGTINDRDDRDIYWSAEFKIPFSEIRGFRSPPQNGSRMGINFYRYDRPSDGSIITTAWSAVGSGSFHNPARFGVLELTGRPDDEPAEVDQEAGGGADETEPEPAEGDDP